VAAQAHLKPEDDEDIVQFCVENEYEDDDENENDAYEILNPAHPRS
jgi:uncharacterized protein YecT (DUF1311 family)